MYNLIVKGAAWADSRDSFITSRIFEHTSDEIKARFSSEGRINFDALTSLPTVFMEESFDGDPIARVGTIVRATQSRREVLLEYFYDPDVPGIKNSKLEEISADLEIGEFEFHRTHWAVKDQDLFKQIFRHLKPRRSQPSVFRLNEPEQIEDVLLSAMMPFAPEFDSVHEMLKEICNEHELSCRRADDIWDNPAIIQDVVSLIDKSRIVVCDCTGRNANVFYEAGIAHTLGREVILITQSPDDIPFDLRHLRYVRYLNNSEGRQDLKAQLSRRVSSLVGD